MTRARTAALALLSIVASTCALPSSGSDGAARPLLVGELRCESQREPRGIGEARPRLSWSCRAQEGDTRRGRSIRAHALRAATSRELLARDAPDLLAGERVEGDAIAVEWPGAPLPSRAEVWWQVRCWDERDAASPWSEPARFTVGLLDERDWSAQWIGAADADTAARATSPWLRTTVELPAAPRRARIWVASLGYHEAWVNGAALGSEVLMPNVSDLSQRVRVVERDCTAALHAGRNAVGLWLGAGWAMHPPYHVPAFPIACAQLEIELADGQRVVVASDESWRVAPSSNELLGSGEPGDFGSERIAAERAALDWCAPAFDDAAWPRARSFAPTVARLAEACEPNRRVTELTPVAIEPLRDGAWRVDFGRNFAGQTRAALRGEPGATVKLSWSERSDHEELFGQRGELVLDRDGRGTYEQRFSYAAGRWLVIEGTRVAPRADDVRAWLVRNDCERGATFRCGEPLLQQLHDTAAWTFECLALGGMPVDCPHRERLGYGGDAHATMALGLSLFRGDALFAKWQDDWRSVQRADGNLPFTAPTLVGGGGPAWSAIVVALAWEQWRRGGDVRVLQRAWPAIERWLAFLETRTRDGALEPWCVPEWAAPRVSFLGDWLPPGAGLVAPLPDDKSRYFNDAWRIASVRRAASIATIVGEPARSRELAARADELAAALHARCWRPQRGAYVADRQVNHLLALFAELGDEPLRATLLARLADELATKRHLETGLHGTWLLFEELLARGRADLLIALARQRDFPSWGWFLDQGLTTFPEDWSAELSRLHACWLPIGRLGVEGIAGLRPDPSGDPASAGWRRFVVQPTFDAAIPWATATQPTPHGVARVAWRRDGAGAIELEVDVPVGTTAQLVLPAGTLAGDDAPAAGQLPSGSWRWRFTPTPPSRR